MMSTRRDLYLLMLSYSNHKDHLNTDDLARFLETEQKVQTGSNGTQSYFAYWSGSFFKFVLFCFKLFLVVFFTVKTHNATDLQT